MYPQHLHPFLLNEPQLLSKIQTKQKKKSNMRCRKLKMHGCTPEAPTKRVFVSQSAVQGVAAPAAAAAATMQCR